MLVGPDDGIEMNASDGTPEGFELGFDEGRHFLLLNGFYDEKVFARNSNDDVTVFSLFVCRLRTGRLRYKGSTFFLAITYRYSSLCTSFAPLNVGQLI